MKWRAIKYKHLNRPHFKDVSTVLFLTAILRKQWDTVFFCFFFLSFRIPKGEKIISSHRKGGNDSKTSIGDYLNGKELSSKRLAAVREDL